MYSFQLSAVRCCMGKNSLGHHIIYTVYTTVQLREAALQLQMHSSLLHFVASDGFCAP